MMKLRFGGNPYAIVRKDGMVRTIRYGHLAAIYEKLPDEEIIQVEISPKQKSHSDRSLKSGTIDRKIDQ